MKIYKKIQVNPQYNKEEVLRVLNQYNEQGKRVYCDFQGDKVYSDKVNTTFNNQTINKKIININL